MRHGDAGQGTLLVLVLCASAQCVGFRCRFWFYSALGPLAVGRGASSMMVWCDVVWWV